MPGGRHRRHRRGRDYRAYRGSSALHCIATRGRKVRDPARPSPRRPTVSRSRCSARRHTSRPAPDRRPGLRFGTLITGRPGAVAPLRPAHSTCGFGVRSTPAWPQRHTADRRVSARFAPPAGRPGVYSRRSSAKPSMRCCRRWPLKHTLQYRRGVPPVVNEDVSTQILTQAIEAIGPDALADTRQSGGGEDFSGIWRRFPARWRDWVCGR